MEKEEVLNKIYSKTNSGIKLGLERMKKAAEELGNPQLEYKVIHVAGTNGKGSVCTFTESAFRALGFKTGLYTSPHLIDFSERFRINGKCSVDTEWLNVYEDIKNVCEKYDLTFFEISTLIAFVLFKNKEVEYAIIETGLGGRLDATNIVDPEVAIITKIGIDHVAYLGDNILSIANEKFGIIKENKPVIMLRPDEKEVETLAVKIASQRKSNLTFIDFPSEKIDLQMEGDFQQINVEAVLNTIRTLGFRCSQQVLDALSKVSLPGRFERKKVKNRDFIFDVSHNPQAVDELVKNLKKENGDEKVLLVAGLMKDKDISVIINKYCEVADEFIFTKPDTDRSELPANLASMVKDQKIGRTITNSVSDALKIALQKDTLICVTGSFFTVGEALDYLKIKIE